MGLATIDPHSQKEHTEIHKIPKFGVNQHISSRSSCHFVPKDQNKLYTHDKNRKRAELWVKINLFNVFVMYAVGSVHEKLDV